MYPAVKKVTPRDEFMLHIEFDNGETGILNMRPHLDFGVFQRIKDRKVFDRVRVSFDTVEWDSGVDLDPEFVYLHCEKGTLKNTVFVNGISE